MVTERGLIVLLALLALSGCGKVGFAGAMKQAVGDWAQVRLPEGCAPKLIAAEESGGVVVYCEDGRLFH